MRLLEVGEFHGDEVSARTGEAWLGLFPVSDGYALRRTTLTVRKVRDLIVDDEAGPETGKKVGTSHRAEPLFLVRDITSLRPRLVPTVYAGELSLQTTTNASLAMGGKTYQLSVLDNSDSGADADAAAGAGPMLLPQHATLALTVDGSRMQRLFSVDGHDEAHWRLLWAGDLDGDGKLDLYLDLNGHYNVSARRLFLSSAAKSGALVGEVALFETVGC